MTNVPGWLAALAIIVPAGTAIAGYWLAGFNEEKRDRRTAQREREGRHAARVERAEERRHEFQRELLLDLQDVMRVYVRATLKAARHDDDALAETGKVGLLGADLNEEIFEAGIAYSRLRVRVLDDDLRAALETLQNRCVAVELTGINCERDNVPPVQIVARIDSERMQLALLLAQVNELLGEQLRIEIERVPEDTSSQ